MDGRYSFLITITLLSFAKAVPRYDYNNALSKSLLFYLAQRSGHLPDNIIPWRGDSALRDGNDVGKDLTGGWYDAGDHLKLNFPMAGSATNLLWGLIQFHDGYVSSGQLSRMQAVVKWPLDYFLKCWDPSQNTYYGQVGKMDLDHSYWGRPEDMTMSRPTYKLTTTHPGSDLAAETAAALAAGYIAFKDTDEAYAGNLLAASRSLYNFASAHHGLYHHAITDATDAYPSYAFEDELCWGAAWLYKATGETTFKQKAEQALVSAGADSNEFSWDDKIIGCVAILHEKEPAGSSKKAEYAGMLTSFLHKWRNGNGGIHKTHCGLSFLSKWGSLRYAMNAALIALIAAEHGIESSANRKWAAEQVNYALGDNKYGRSYVVGFGVNPPLRPHHSSSSCPSPPATCDWDNFDSPNPNPHVLNGALVGGPDDQDVYDDVRTDYIKNEVTCDYNAGFQSALAGLISLSVRGSLPDANPACPQPRSDVAVTTHAVTTHAVTQAHTPGPTTAGLVLDCTDFGSHRHSAQGTAYYPDVSQGGVMDMNDHNLMTLQDFLEGTVSYVSVAMDETLGLRYGTPLCIPELNQKYHQVILFKVVDSAPEFVGSSYSRINICVRDRPASLDNTINGHLTLVFQ